MAEEDAQPVHEADPTKDGGEETVAEGDAAPLTQTSAKMITDDDENQKVRLHATCEVRTTAGFTTIPA